MNEAEIRRIEQRAGVAEAEAQADAEAELSGGQQGEAQVIDTAAELAEFLNLAANVAGVATRLPVVERFTPDANLKIAREAVKVCGRMGWDAHSLLIGQDSALGAWLGLGVAVAVPGFAVWGDFKAARAKEIEAEEADNGGGGE